MALGALGQRGAAERHALVDRAVVADLGRLADHDAHAVVDEDAPADRRAGVDLDAGEEARQMRDEARQPVQAVAPEPAARGGAAPARAGPDSRSAPPTRERAAGSRSRMQAMSSRRRWNMDEAGVPGRSSLAAASARRWRLAASRRVSARRGAASAPRARCRAGCAPPRSSAAARLSELVQPRHQLARRRRVEEADLDQRLAPVRRAGPATAAPSAARGVARARLDRESRRAPGASRRPAAAPPARGSASRSPGCGRDAEAGVAAVDVVVGQAEALGAEDEGDAVRAAAPARRRARAARASAGRSRAASSRWRRRR